MKRAMTAVQRVNLRLVGPLMLVLYLSLVGCATYAPSPTPEQAPPATRPAPTLPQQPVRALDRLLQESRSKLAARDWQAAIASAERGLRIDRREAELYLLLAQAYRELGNLDRSVQFARQGLRYVTSERSPIARALNELAASNHD